MMKNELRPHKLGFLATALIVWAAFGMAAVLGSDACGFVWLYATLAYLAVVGVIAAWTFVKWLFRLATQHRTMPRLRESVPSELHRDETYPTL